MAELKGGDLISAYLEKAVAKLGGSEAVRIGFFEGATYEDGTPVATVAAVQNFGSAASGIPPRPFFSRMIEAKRDGWGKSMGCILVNQDYDTTKTLELMGKGVEGQLRQSIVDTVDPPLSEKTIARKGFAKPLVDTGQMLNSIDSEVTGT